MENKRVFRTIEEKEKIVEVHRILYGASNWIYKL